ncbi:unnamed protein product [Dibothriocephalus latus]|uniref:Uncharacterized protein n=1 Tax=Dibothriocephalus latus TaxID=60516 RepID=A0A3P6TUL2_DIBLA|nr:unnamed protein product [Dibothriocephalus latus]
MEGLTLLEDGGTVKTTRQWWNVIELTIVNIITNLTKMMPGSATYSPRRTKSYMEHATDASKTDFRKCPGLLQLQL